VFGGAYFINVCCPNTPLFGGLANGGGGWGDGIVLDIIGNPVLRAWDKPLIGVVFRLFRIVR